MRINDEALAGLGPEERLQAEADLRELEAIRKANPLAFYQPHAKQVVLHESPDPVRAFLGGNRSGKTTAGMLDDLVQAVDRSVVPEHLLPYKRWDPPFFCRLVIPDLTRTLHGVILQKIREWCPPGQLRGGSVEKAWDEKQSMLSFANGSWFQIMSNDQDLDKFMGVALHRVHYDEEPREDIRRECKMRLVDHGGDELFTMTPLLGMSWMFGDIYEPWAAGKLDGEVTVVTVAMDENPHLDRKAMARALAGLSKEERQARERGQFVHFAGLIYSEFSRSAHVVPDETGMVFGADGKKRIPPDAKVIVGIDAGLRIPAVLYCWIRRLPTGGDELVVFDEIALRDTTVGHLAEEIELRNLRWGVKPKWYVIDPAAKNRESQTGRSTQDELNGHGIPTILGQNAVSAGINRVKERLERPGALKIWASCEVLIAEFARYRWRSPARGMESSEREAPVKRDDHFLDALRYVCMSRPIAPKAASRESLTMKDRLLRSDMARRFRPRQVEHPSGPGVFA